MKLQNLLGSYVHPLASSRFIGLVVFISAWTSPATARLVSCADDGGAIAAALAELRHSVDPCGESADIQAVLDKIERCTGSVYNVCTDPTATRNVFDRPMSHFGLAAARTITWNPKLQTEVELECAGDSTQPLSRDPTASLLHELVHAAQDCDGLNPGEHELEAVRIENIYRRAAGLCQRIGYGAEPLPAAMVVSCATRPCSCSTPPGVARVDDDPAPAGAGEIRIESAVPPILPSESSGDRAVP